MAHTTAAALVSDAPIITFCGICRINNVSAKIADVKNGYRSNFNQIGSFDISNLWESSVANIYIFAQDFLISANKLSNTTELSRLIPVAF